MIRLNTKDKLLAEEYRYINNMLDAKILSYADDLLNQQKTPERGGHLTQMFGTGSRKEQDLLLKSLRAKIRASETYELTEQERTLVRGCLAGIRQRLNRQLENGQYEAAEDYLKGFKEAAVPMHLPKRKVIIHTYENNGKRHVTAFRYYELPFSYGRFIAA